jgi:type IV secretory pathway VirB6-like protein
MREINIFLEKLMFLAIIGIPIGIFMIAVQSDGRFSFAALATLVVTAVLILSFSILSPLLEIAANSRKSEELLRKIANNTRIQNPEATEVTPTRVTPTEVTPTEVTPTYVSPQERERMQIEHENRKRSQAMKFNDPLAHG